MMRRSRLLLCPIVSHGTLSSEADGYRCRKCNAFYPVVEGVVDLRRDAGFDTLLELDSYEAAHNTGSEHSRLIYGLYKDIFDKFHPHRAERVLEIGAGAGNLTLGLLKHGSFKAVHCSELSLRFMTRLRQKAEAEGVENRGRYYLFDAESLPFASASFDIVVGHSVLHHVLNFERTIFESFRVLKPGGIAIFAEPMAETHALAGLAAQLVVEVDGMLPERRLGPETRKILLSLSAQGSRKLGHLVERGESVLQFEDKFVFPGDYMRDTAWKAGFSRFALHDFAAVKDLGALIQAGMKKMVPDEAKQELDAFAPLFTAFTKGYQNWMGPFLHQKFVFNVFIKGP